jgi:hypothetical protein
MIPMNDFIVGNEANIRKFFDKLIISPEEQDEDQKEEEESLRIVEENRISAVNADPALLADLSKYLVDAMEAIRAKAKDLYPEGEVEVSLEQLQSLLGELS